MIVNKIFQDLLSLQQDGALAAIGPHNWGKVPYPGLIETEQVKTIRGIADQLKNNSSTGVWHFLIGAPGNGKSALIGDLTRSLCEAGWSEYDSKHEDQSLSYISQFSRKDDDFPSLVIVQDASVSSSPHDPKISLSEQLATAIDSAYKKRHSLIVCANRGVLEQLPSIEHIQDKDWFKQINRSINQDKDYTSKIIFPPKANKINEVKFTCVQLDHERISLGEESDLQKLLVKLVSDERWNICTTCDYKNECPFHLNQALLSRREWQDRLVKILVMLELYRGQPLVFREASALLSIVLSGPSSDYSDGYTPCNWVAEKVRDCDYQSLLSRRIYMALFSGESVWGLDTDEALKHDQMSHIESMFSKTNVEESIWNAFKSDGLSGISGCDDARKVYTELDPLMEVHSDEDLARCLIDSKDMEEYLARSPELWSLEQQALNKWNELSKLIQDHKELSSDGSYGLLHRISSSFLVRLMGFANHFNIQLRFESEIAEFEELIETVNSDWESDENIDNIDSHQKNIRDAIERISGSSADRTNLAENLEAGNEFLGKVASMSIKHESDPLCLHVILTFGASKVTSQLNGELFCWIQRTLPKKYLTLSPSFIPKNLVAGVRVARRQAISLGQYLQNEDAELFTHSMTKQNSLEYHMYRSPGTRRVLVRGE